MLVLPPLPTCDSVTALVSTPNVASQVCQRAFQYDFPSGLRLAAGCESIGRICPEPGCCDVLLSPTDELRYQISSPWA